MAGVPACTRFGSAVLPLPQAAGVLRARAAREGLDLLPADDLDLAAAVVGADAWSLLARTGSLEAPSRLGPPAVRALAALLARAAGHGLPPVVPLLVECADEPALISCAEAHRDLAWALLPGQGEQVLRLAASDLAAAGPGTAFMAYAALLLMEG